jgi:hypothetical protein
VIAFTLITLLLVAFAFAVCHWCKDAADRKRLPDE